MSLAEVDDQVPESKVLTEHDKNGLSSHSRMQINDTKAGMENIDKEKINAIIQKHSQSKSTVFLQDNAMKLSSKNDILTKKIIF